MSDSPANVPARYNRYTEADREGAFQEWYRQHRPVLTVFANSYVTPSHNLKVPVLQLRKWHETLQWEARADDLDLMSYYRAEQQLVEERAQMIQRHRAVGQTLIAKGLRYMQGNEIYTESGALRALEAGVAIERQSLGMPQLVAAVQNMSVEQLRNMLGQLVAQVDNTTFDQGVVNDDIDSAP